MRAILPVTEVCNNVRTVSNHALYHPIESLKICYQDQCLPKYELFRSNLPDAVVYTSVYYYCDAL
jgi:hypothetical protein